MAEHPGVKSDSAGTFLILAVASTWPDCGGNKWGSGEACGRCVRCRKQQLGIVEPASGENT